MEERMMAKKGGSETATLFLFEHSFCSCIAMIVSSFLIPLSLSLSLPPSQKQKTNKNSLCVLKGRLPARRGQREHRPKVQGRRRSRLAVGRARRRRGVGRGGTRDDDDASTEAVQKSGLVRFSSPWRRGQSRWRCLREEQGEGHSVSFGVEQGVPCFCFFCFRWKVKIDPYSEEKRGKEKENRKPEKQKKYNQCCSPRPRRAWRSQRRSPLPPPQRRQGSESPAAGRWEEPRRRPRRRPEEASALA